MKLFFELSAPGLGVYAEINMISDALFDGMAVEGVGAENTSLTNDTTSLVLGANISF